VAPVTLFQSHNYKLCVSLGLNPRVVTPVRDVLDTGEGPNLVREDVLPRNLERALIPGQLLPRVHNASGRRMPVKGVVSLVTQVGELVRRVRFFVVPCLSVPCILGCHFINTHVLGIFPGRNGWNSVIAAPFPSWGSLKLVGRLPKPPPLRPPRTRFASHGRQPFRRDRRPTFGLLVPWRACAYLLEIIACGLPR
jgi:hypothetical protein